MFQQVLKFRRRVMAPFLGNPRRQKIWTTLKMITLRSLSKLSPVSKFVTLRIPDGEIYL